MTPSTATTVAAVSHLKNLINPSWREPRYFPARNSPHTCSPDARHPRKGTGNRTSFLRTQVGDERAHLFVRELRVGHLHHVVLLVQRLGGRIGQDHGVRRLEPTLQPVGAPPCGHSQEVRTGHPPALANGVAPRAPSTHEEGLAEVGRGCLRPKGRSPSEDRDEKEAE